MINNNSGRTRVHLLTYRAHGRVGVAASRDGKAYRGLSDGDVRYPGPIDGVIRQSVSDREASISALLGGSPVDLSTVEVLQPLSAPGKIICVGLNYRDHANESGMAVPEYPTLFARFPSSLIPH